MRCCGQVLECECKQSYICLRCGNGTGTLPCRCDGILLLPRKPDEVPDALAARLAAGKPLSQYVIEERHSGP